MTIHFGEYALWCAVLCMGATLILYRRLAERLLAGLLFMQAFTIFLQAYPLEHYFVRSHPASTAQTQQYSLLYTNVRALGPLNDKLNSMIEQHQPDMVALVEVTKDWLTALPALEQYPYRKVQFEPGAYGLALFAKAEFKERSTHGLGFDLVPTIHVRFSEPRLDFSLVHFMPPISSYSYWHDRTLARRLATQYRDSNRASLVAGDFNATPYSVMYGVLVDGAYLLNAFAGFSYPRTWSERSWLFALALDHVFYKGPITITDARVLEDFGSDHLPLFVRYSL
ncbi:MAG: endonuclease/exonuclease/phosphatase family protein [Bdellovibrionales bacterium]|nr:endonuclease/exonuclease/phosphatase family protein [Bdellovibrionales bacterium]